MEISKLEELSNSTDYSERVDAVSDKECPAEILDRLSNDENLEVRMHVSYHKNTSPEILVKLSLDKIYEVKSGVAGNPNTPTEGLLNILKNDKEWDNKEYAMNHPNVSINDIRDLLMNSGDIDKMSLSAKSEKCTYDDFIFLSTYEEDEDNIKNALATNKNTPTHILKSYIENRIYGIENILLKNKHCPSEILDMLYDNFYDKVEYLGSGDSYYARRERAKSLDASQEELEKLSNDKVENVRAEVAKNPNATKKILEKLSTDENYLVQGGVAGNPNTPLEVLKLLSEKELSAFVKEILAKNPNIQTTIVDFNEDEKADDLKMSTERSMLDQYLLTGLANHPNASETLLDKIYKKNDSLFFYLIEHENTHFSTLLEIRKDVLTMEKGFIKDNYLERIDKRIEAGLIEANDENTSSQRLDELSKYENDHIKWLVASNKNTSLKTLKELAKDRNWPIDFQIIQNKNSTLELMSEIVEDNENAELYINFFTLLHPDTSYERTIKISKENIDKHPLFQYMAFININTPIEILKKKYEDLNEEEKYNLASGKYASLKTLKLLAEEQKYFFKEYVYHHPNCVGEFKQKIYKEIKEARVKRMTAMYKADEEKHEANTDNRTSMHNFLREIF